MVMCDQDQDVVRWGLHHLFGGHTYDTSGACGCSNHNGVPYYSSDYGRDYQYNNQYNSQYIHQQSSVENDEVLAHALQEELRQLAVAESSGTTESGLQASILAQDWLPSRDYHREMDDQREDYDDSGPSSCSSPERKAYDDEGIYGSLELTYESSALDGEVCKRLNQMVPVPHVPRINGEIPSVDEATSDHQRLSNRLQLYDLVELKVEGDGNCQFRALSDQFYRTPEHHKFVRQQVVNQLKSYPETYCGYVPMTYDEYIEKMSSAGQWGDHVTLQAAADSYGVKICVITSFKDTCFIEILPNVQKTKRVIFLSFWAEVHYNSIYPEGDAPLTETKKKKKWWHW